MFLNRGARDPQVSNRRRWLQKTRVGLSQLNVSELWTTRVCQLHQIENLERRFLMCSNMAFAGDSAAVFAKNSKPLSLIDCSSVGFDRMRCNFEPMRKQVEAWQSRELTDVTAKVAIYEAFFEGKLDAPKHLARNVHDLYFEPTY